MVRVPVSAGPPRSNSPERGTSLTRRCAVTSSGGIQKERWASMSSVASEERLDLRPLELDVQEEASCRAAVDRIVADEGGVDVAMNNAAMMMHGLTEAFRPEQVLQILDLNPLSWLRVNRAVLPVILRAGQGPCGYPATGSKSAPAAVSW